MVFFVFLLVALPAYLAHQALVSPDVPFLPPAIHGEWIVPLGPVFQREAVFYRRFDLPAVPDRYPIRIRAMRASEITVDGAALPGTRSGDWKRPAAYDLASALRAGRNEIRIRVSVPAPPPALLVEGPALVRSDARWTVEIPGAGTGERQAAVAYEDDRRVSDRPNPFRVSPRYRLWVAAFVAYLAFIAYTLVPLRWKPWIPPAAEHEANFWDRRGVALLLFLAVAVIQIRNAYVYPYSRGLDGMDHVRYVQYVAKNRTIPDASTGWEMSQPPLYYVLGAGIYQLFGGAARPTFALKAVQLCSPVVALGELGLAWWMLGFVHPARARMRMLGFIVVGVLPVLFYMATEISNEPFAGFAAGSAMCIAMRQMSRRDDRWRDGVAVGAICGVALLSKQSAAFVLVAVLCLAALRTVARPPRLRRAAWGGVVVVIAIALSGWLYARNVQRFGTPFIGAWDPRSGFNIVQPPGYRTLAFYTRFGSVFWQQRFTLPNASFWDGMYDGVWTDSHGVFLRGDRQADVLSSVGLWLALLPTVAVVLGFLQATWRLATREWDHAYFVPVVTTLLTETALLSFTMEHPWFSTLKPQWALALVPAVAVFAGEGLDTMCRQAGRGRWLLYANLAALAGLVLYLFWYRAP